MVENNGERDRLAALLAQASKDIKAREDAVRAAADSIQSTNNQVDMYPSNTTYEAPDRLSFFDTAERPVVPATNEQQSNGSSHESLRAEQRRRGHVGLWGAAAILVSIGVLASSSGDVRAIAGDIVGQIAPDESAATGNAKTKEVVKPTEEKDISQESPPQTSDDQRSAKPQKVAKLVPFTMTDPSPEELPDPSPTPEEVESVKHPFKVMSYNMRGASHTDGPKPQADSTLRMKREVEIIALQEPDVIAVQEFQRTQRQDFKKFAPDKYMIIPEQPDYEHQGPSVNSIIINTKRFEFIQGGTDKVWYFSDKDMIEIPFVVVKDKETGKKILFRNVHDPASTGQFPGNGHKRTANARIHAQFSKEWEDKVDAVVVLGDFNSKENSNKDGSDDPDKIPLQILENAEYVPTSRLDDRNQERTTVDWILVNKEHIKVFDSLILSPRNMDLDKGTKNASPGTDIESDHDPVVAEVAVR